MLIKYNEIITENIGSKRTDVHLAYAMQYSQLPMVSIKHFYVEPGPSTSHPAFRAAC